MVGSSRRGSGCFFGGAARGVELVGGRLVGGQSRQLQTGVQVDISPAGEMMG